MYSIDAFLLGDCRRATLYYSDILQKGIDLIIYDFDGAIAKLSPFSTLRFGDQRAGEKFLAKSLKSIDELIYDLENILSMPLLLKILVGYERKRE